MTIAKIGRGKEQWLKTEVKDGRLVISVGVDVLAFAAQQFYDEEAFHASEGQEDESDFRIVAPADFAKSVVRALDREAEDGTTPVHLMFDEAFKWLTDFSAPDGVEDASEARDEVPLP